jgi:tripartite-type tricarboxylate transporter receptor subunit TctC
MMPFRNLLSCALAGLALASSLKAADAQPAASNFFAGKTVSLIIAYPPGGGFDSSARLLMRHMNRHIPGNPVMVPRNVPGAGSLVATNYLYNVAPKDGTEFGLIGGSVPFGPLWSRDGVKFEAEKFNWIGSMDRWVGIALMSHEAPVTSLEQAMKSEVTVGATGAGDVTSIYPRVINALIGTKFKIVSGYKGTADLNLAIERGEVAGRLGWCWDCVKAEKPDWVEEKKVKVMIQLAFAPEPELPGVPVLLDVVKSEEDRQIVKLVFGSQEMARPFVLPPGVPQDRVALLRSAFEATLADPEFQAEAKRLNMPVKHTSWQDIEKLIADVYATPKPVIDRAAKIIGEQ